MKQQLQTQEEWLRVLTKGMITIPKAWREELGFRQGDIIKARKLSDKMIIESTEKKVPYRIYTQRELQQFIREDTLPGKLAKIIDRKYGARG